LLNSNNLEQDGIVENSNLESAPNEETLEELKEDLVLDKEQNDVEGNSDLENLAIEEICEGSQEDLNLDNEQVLEKSRLKRIKDVLWYVAFSLVLVLTILTVCSVTFFDCYVVKGDSMLNTVETNDKVTVCSWEKPKVGDVIILKDLNSASGDKEEVEGGLLIKRLIAVGPAYVTIKQDGTVYVNMVELKEPYLSSEYKTRGNSLCSESLKYEGKSEINQGYFVEKGKIFYLGDNRSVSKDSRSVGAVSKDLIIGKVSNYFLKKKDNKFYKIITTNYVQIFIENIKRKCK